MKRLLAIFLAAAAVSTGVAVSQAPGQQATPAAPPAATALAATGSGRGQVVDGVAATVNDDVISHEDVRNRMRMILLSFNGQPDQDVLREAQNQALESLIDEKVELQEFKKLAKDQKITDEEIDQRIAEMADQNKLTREQFLQSLTQAGISTRALRDQVRAELAWTDLVRGRYARQVRISEQRIDEMLSRIKETLDKPQYNVGEIFLFAPDQASRANAMTRADTLIKQINKGDDFRSIARQFSAAPSASRGGLLDWVTLGDLRPEVAAAVRTAPAPPTVLPPVESEGGVYIIALLGKQEPSDASAATLNMKQVVARGDGAADKLTQIKAKVTNCGQLAAAVQGVEGVTAPVDMNGVTLKQLTAAVRPALENVQEGQSTDPIDLPDGGKMIFFVCARQSGNAAALPTRDKIKARLFDIEISMLEERYRRDLKRKASIQRRA